MGTMARKYVMLGFVIGGCGFVLWQTGEGILSSLGLGGLVCGGGYLVLGLLRIIFKR